MPSPSWGIDETSWLKATRSRPTLYATGLVDIDARMLIDMVEGNSAHDLRGWCARQDPAWLAAIGAVTADLAESYRAGLHPTWPMPDEWPIPSTSSGSETAASTRPCTAFSMFRP